MDMEFGPDGTFYLLTYGDGFFAINPDAGMMRWEYVKGLRPPVAVVSATPTSGAVPLTVAFSSAGSNDADPGDSIRFEWDFDGNGTVDSIEPNPTHTYTTAGEFTAKLSVIDSSGKSGVANTTITVGNTAPTVAVTVPVDGGTFAFGENIPFTVTVTDPEDGTIDCSDVHVTFVLGHDTHGHAEASTTGCSGVLPTDAGDVSHGGNVFGVISASYTDGGGSGGVPSLTTVAQNQIRQKKQEVEFVVNQSGTNTASSADAGGGLQRGGLSAGDWLQLNGPFNLLNIDSVTFRISGGTNGANSGAVEIHRDAVDGPIVTTVDIVGTANATTYASQTFPLADSGTHEYFLVFRAVPGGPLNNFFNLNWIEFVGNGVGTPP
jgi:PKD repeat protein